MTYNSDHLILIRRTSVATYRFAHIFVPWNLECVAGPQLKTGFLAHQEQVAAQPINSASQSPRLEDQSHKAHGQQTEGGSNTLAPPPPYPGPPPPYPGAVQVRFKQFLDSVY